MKLTPGEKLVIHRRRQKGAKGVMSQKEYADKVGITLSQLAAAESDNRLADWLELKIPEVGDLYDDERLWIEERRHKFGMYDYITLEQTQNTKRGASRERYHKYEHGMKVVDAILAGLWRSDVRYDVDKRHITLSKKPPTVKSRAKG